MEITRTYHRLEEEIEVSAEIYNIKTSYDGIGSYEFWGQKGFDKGKLIVDSFAIKILTIDPAPENIFQRDWYTFFLEEKINEDVSVIEEILENMVDNEQALKDEYYDET